MMTKELFIQSSGVKAMCDNDRYLDCLGLQKEKCHADLDDCLKLIPPSFKQSEGNPIMNEFSSCLVNKNNYSDEKYDECDLLLDD